MSRVSSEKAKAIFLAAIEINVSDRRLQFLDQICMDDRELRDRVDKLLLAHELEDCSDSQSVPSVHDSADHDGTLDYSPLFQEGSMFGPYRLREKLGSGGMGVVWAADQKTPLRRRVALKLIKPGMDSEQVIARFEAEREALSLMDHPNIAKVLDAGTGPSGHPYFAMELVRGVPITDYCDQSKLSVEERVRLFTHVCYAIQHAHQKGIIHRDIKPSNVLVTLHDGIPVPKVIDFGVAKALHHRLSDLTVYTRVASAVGTPLYMSPEQAELSGLDIDTRSDIYSLGVLLYELLTGEPPMSREFVSNSPFEEVRRVIREVEPQKPSTRVSSLGTNAAQIAGSRGTDSQRLARKIKGDLDWILLKTLEKDRTRRYATAQGLANDLMRHLNDEPVEASPPSLTYRFRKNAWRHRKAIAATVGSLIVIVVLLFGGYQLNEQRAEVKAAKARERIRRIEIPEIERLADEENYLDAYLLGKAARDLLSDDAMLDRAFARAAVDASITSDPPGATIEIASASEKKPQWTEFDLKTPIENQLLPRGPLRIRVSLEGFYDRVKLCVLDNDSIINVVLDDVSSCPPDMVRIANQERSFLVDKFEVSNRAYQKFVDEKNGYHDLQYWTELVEDTGGEEKARQVLNTFVDDSSKQLGPRNWINGRFPPGEENHPVRGISWYEACAYARSERKSLLAAPDWQRAATRNLASYLLPIANYSSDEPLDCGDNNVVGGNGIYDMAGNVSEWTMTRDEGSWRRVCGGSFPDPSYVFFSNYVSVNAADRPLKVGFRCAKYQNVPETRGDTRDPDRYNASMRIDPGVEWESCLRQFDYDRTLPLNSKTIYSESMNSYCKYELVRIDAPYGHEELNLHFFIPHEPSELLQTIVYLPGASSTRLIRFDDAIHLADAKNVEEFVKNGRLVCWPEIQRTFGRRREQRNDRLAFFQRVMDVRRTVDYLHHRGGIDTERLALIGYSWGAHISPVVASIEPRFDTLILLSSGLAYNNKPPELTPYAYAPFVKQPVLMFNGSRDHNHPIDRSQRPLRNLFGAMDSEKRLIIEDYDHDLPPKRTGEVVNEWLNERFGKPRD